MTTHLPTPEQSAILAAGADPARSSMMISAYAGCGKTSTLELLCRESITDEPVLYLVFNARNKREAEGRFPSHVSVLTMNGLGHAALGRGLGRRLTLDDRKLGKTITAALRAIPQSEQPPDLWGQLRELVTAAMCTGIVPGAFGRNGLAADTADAWAGLTEDPPAGPTIDLARAVLSDCIKSGLAGTISFDEQVYLSVLFAGQFPRFRTVLVDESQDLSPLQHRMVARCAADRIIAVGDAKQAIYAWRGADSASMASLRKLRQSWVDLPLATTFRCPKIIVERASHHAPGFTAWSTNASGVHARLARWSWPNVEAFADAGSPIAVLCRNNAPLLSLAFKLIRTGIGVSMAGRDIGKGLIALVQKLGPDPMAIYAWKLREIALALANDDGAKADAISDRAECLLAVLADIPTPSTEEVERKLTALFARENCRVLLSSIHRAKGLEFPTVLHLDPFRIPSKFARGDALVQERNLLYVCETRTQHTLIEANLEDYTP